ncbi:Divergent AAA domain protein [Candidatus Rubidus massiliensis]|nr:Divergent AAA domain protein [Candidatus Rubidus massiliensis]
MNSEFDQEEDFQELLARYWTRPENRIDFKEPFIFDRKVNPKPVLGIVKDILAMTNSEGGGIIIIGKDKNGKAIECTDEIINSFDPSNVHSLVKNFGRPEPTFTIGVAKSPEQTRAIIILVNEFHSQPTICCAPGEYEQNTNGKQKKETILKEASLYIRSKTGNASSAEIRSEQDMRSLIDRAVLRRKDELVAFIQKIGKSLTPTLPIWEEKKVDLEDQWKETKNSLKRELKKYVSAYPFNLDIEIYPHTFDPLLLSDVPTMQRMLESAIENHKGWSFPFPRDSLKEKDLVFKNDEELIVYTDGPMIHQNLSTGFAMHSSGLILYRENLAELPGFSGPNRMQQKILFIPRIYLTWVRMVRFIGKFYSFLPDQEQIKISTIITDTFERLPSGSVHDALMLAHKYHDCNELNIARITISVDLNINTIRCNPNEACITIAKQFCNRLNISVSDEVLQTEFSKLL